MAIHLTPTELAREIGMQRREVIARCMELGVPIFQGRIDKTLFVTSLRDAQRRREPAKACGGAGAAARPSRETRGRAPASAAATGASPRARAPYNPQGTRERKR